MKIKAIVLTLLFLAGCSDKERVDRLARSILNDCNAPVSMSMRSGLFGAILEIECPDIKIESND